MSKPKKVDNFTQGCACDHCGKALHANHIWIWEEHFGCCRECVSASYHEARPDLVPRGMLMIVQEPPSAEEVERIRSQFNAAIGKEESSDQGQS